MRGKSLFPLCALEYFIRITKQWYNNKRKETKKTSEFPKIVKVKWWDSISPDHLAITPYSSNPTPRDLLWMIDGSWAFWWAVERGSDLKSSCSWAHCLYQIALLLSLYLTSLPDLFSWPLFLTSFPDLSSPSTTPLYLITFSSLSLLLLGLRCSPQEDSSC